MSGGQHRVDEVTRTESRGLDRKNNPRIAAHRPPKETAGLRNAGVCAKGTKKESNTLDAADLVRDVAKSSSHHLSQTEIGSDKPVRNISNEVGLVKSVWLFFLFLSHTHLPAHSLACFSVSAAPQFSGCFFPVQPTGSVRVTSSTRCCPPNISPITSTMTSVTTSM